MDELMMKKLQNLLDKVAIEDKIKLYAQNLDTKNFENMRAIFMPGAHIDYTVAGGAKCCFEEMLSYWPVGLNGFNSQHLMGNVQVKVSDDRSTAESTHILFNPMTRQTRKGEYTFFCGLHYDCKWQRTEDDDWKITEMIERDLCYMYHRPI